MTFSTAQYEAALGAIDSGVQKTKTKIGEVKPAAAAAVGHWYVPQGMADAVIWLADKAVDLAQKFLDTILDLLKGAVAPVFMFKDAWTWHGIAGKATTLGSSLDGAQLESRISEHWQGDAVDAYKVSAAPQSTAVNQIGSIAGSMATALTVSAGAALAFYVALGVIIGKFIIAMVGVVVALGSVAFSWAGVLLAVEECGVNGALIAAAVTALLAALGVQVERMIDMHGVLSSGTGFADGAWPQAVTRGFSDSTVKDGDADWSVKTA